MGLIFSQDFIEKVRQANNLLEVIAPHTELKGTGHRHMGRCPFPDHQDKSPSFSVSEDAQLYFCYGCKKGGNIYHFLQSFNGMSFPEAVEFLARRASIPLPEDDRKGSHSGPTRDDKNLLLKINRAAAVFYYQQFKQLPIDHPAKLYLKKRGFTEETCEKFKIGIALEEWSGLTQFFQQKKVPVQAAESLGLIKRKKGGQGHFDLFRERIMFPIFSPTGDVLGFGGRTYVDALPKYINSSDSPAFSKGRVLYALNESGKYVRSQDEIIVVEGYMDAIALFEAGFRNVVAILGTALTPEHVRLIKRYTTHVKLLLDGDNAGMEAAERSLTILLQGGVLPKACFLAGAMDPDDFIKANGPEALALELEKAADLFNLVLARHMQSYHASPTEKINVIENLAPILLHMENKQLQELYLHEMGQRLDVENGFIRRALQKVALKLKPVNPVSPVGPIGQNTSAVPGKLPQTPQKSEVVAHPEENASGKNQANLSEESSIESPQIIVKGAPRDEVFAISLALHNEGLLKEIGQQNLIEIFSHAGVRRLLEMALENYRQTPGDFAKLAASLASQLDQPSIVTCCFEILSDRQSEKRDETEERKLMSDYLTAIRKRSLNNRAKLMANELRNQSSPEKLEQFMNIQRDRLLTNKE